MRFARAVMSTNPPTPAVTWGRAASRETLTLPSASTSRNESIARSKPPPWRYWNWSGEAMRASGFCAQPNAKPRNGTPPTAPCSITHVTSPSRPSSTRIRGTSAEMPNPRFDRFAVTELDRGAPGDHLLGAPLGELERGAGRSVVAGRLREELGLRRLELIGGNDDRVDHDARHADGLRRQRPALGESLDLGDDVAAVVVGSERLVEHAERRPLVLAREVPVLVGGRGADDRHVNSDGPQVEPLSAVELDHRRRCPRWSCRSCGRRGGAGP